MKTMSKQQFLKRVQMVGKVATRLNEMGVRLTNVDEGRVMSELFGALDRDKSYVLIVVKLKDGIRRRSYELQDLEAKISVPPHEPMVGI